MRYILILCFFILLSSCRSYREKTKQETNRIRLSEANSGIRYGFQLVGKDSLERTWSFVTDSMLYFHPDAGLYSSGGHLRIRESQLGLQQWQAELDSFDIKRDVQGVTEKQAQSRRWFDHSWWIWGIVVCCVLVFYRLVRI